MYERPTTSFEEEFKWSRPWIPRIRALVGPHVLREGTIEEDRREATDLIVLQFRRGFRIACRVRHPGYAERWPYDVTVTCRRETGSACEWHKLFKNHVEGEWWFFYGHATTEKPSDPHADIWPRFLLDLSVARDWMLRNHGPERGPNGDTDGVRCWFYAFDVRTMIEELGPRCIVAANPVLPRPVARGHQIVLPGIRTGLGGVAPK